jgi:hypothetical protein
MVVAFHEKIILFYFFVVFFFSFLCFALDNFFNYMFMVYVQVMVVR